MTSLNTVNHRSDIIHSSCNNECMSVATQIRKRISNVICATAVSLAISICAISNANAMPPDKFGSNNPFVTVSEVKESEKENENEYDKAIREGAEVAQEYKGMKSLLIELVNEKKLSAESKSTLVKMTAKHNPNSLLEIKDVSINEEISPNAYSACISGSKKILESQVKIIEKYVESREELHEMIPQINHFNSENEKQEWIKKSISKINAAKRLATLFKELLNAVTARHQ